MSGVYYFLAMENIIPKRFKESGEVRVRFLKENLPRVIEAIKLVSLAFERGNKLLIFGNGEARLTPSILPRNL